jgi:hypothetical protein
MHLQVCQLLPWLILAFLSVASTGCVEGPLGRFAQLNPMIRKQWAEDEKYGPTFHRRLADLRGLRAVAARLDPQKKEDIARDVAQHLPAETNPVIRAEMVAILGELGTGSCPPALRVAIADSDKDVRIAACRASAKLGENDGLPILIALMEQETDVDVRLAVIAELGRFSDQMAVNMLGNALDDNDPAIQHMAVQSLKTSTRRDYGDSIPAWRDYVQGREPQLPPAPSLAERIANWF